MKYGEIAGHFYEEEAFAVVNYLWDSVNYFNELNTKNSFMLQYDFEDNQLKLINVYNLKLNFYLIGQTMFENENILKYEINTGQYLRRIIEVPIPLYFTKDFFDSNPNKFTLQRVIGLISGVDENGSKRYVESNFEFMFNSSDIQSAKVEFTKSKTSDMLWGNDVEIKLHSFSYQESNIWISLLQTSLIPQTLNVFDNLEKHLQLNYY